MDGSLVMPEDQQLDPPARIFERLRQLGGFTWDESRKPFHSSYDNWHIYGTRFISPYSTTTTTPLQNLGSPPSIAKLASSRISPGDVHVGFLSQSEGSSERSSASPPAFTSLASDLSNVEEQQIVARVSYHVLREERTFHIAKSLIATADPEGVHNVKPIDLLRLNPQPGDRAPIIVAIYEHPGENYLFRALDLGPAFYYAKKIEDRFEAYRKNDFLLEPPISLMHFLDFAIGATQCLEILHHGHGMVHGEIRADAFHFNMETNKVKLISFGSGVRSFEHGLTSTGWSTLSKELGAKNKLVYISPEQTGRMPAEPDTRTDIYSLGVLFWMLLTQQPVFTGATPLDIVQCVLNRRIPLVSNIRTDVPEVLGRIIQKCTAKNISDRYYSASGLRHDLQMIQKLLGNGDWKALKEWHIASRDISSFFMLPTAMIGRRKEHAELVKILERVARGQAIASLTATNRYSDGSGLSAEFIDTADVSSEGASSAEGEIRRSGSFTQTTLSDPKQSRSAVQSSVNGIDTQTVSGSNDTISSCHTASKLSKTLEKHPSVAFEAKTIFDTIGERQSSSRHSGTETTGSLSRQLGSARFRRRGYCEVVTIEGAGGLGKSFLVQQVLADARRRGYCATAKFDTARRTAFGPLLKLVSSLFKQVWGESNTDTPLHRALKDYVRPIWPMLHNLLGLPEFLLGSQDRTYISPLLAQGLPNGRINRAPMSRRSSSPVSSPGKPRPQSPRVTSQTSQDFLRAGAATKTIRLMNTFLDILRIFTSHHFVCLCLDDLQFADDESLELITQVVSARLKMVLIVTYRPDELSPDDVQKIIQPADTEEHPKSGGPRVTRIRLAPLTEYEILQYVASTLCRPQEDVANLARVIQSKTAGNPFYMREMLSACYRKRCIWYDYKKNRWDFNLDSLFEQFKGEDDYDVLNNDFITRRLSELPAASRSILAWAALLGTTFSFELICQLLNGSFDPIDDGGNEQSEPLYCAKYSKQDAVAGLQAAINACIIVQSESDDRFRFAHDRYVQAAASLKECNTPQMHFAIAQTLLNHYGDEVRVRDNTASHIAEAVEIIKDKVHFRQPYRKHLVECAALAVENGARSTAAKYYHSAIMLLQPDPWADGPDDVDYEETLKLHLRAAECYIYMGNHAAAHNLANAIITGAKNAEDKAPAWLLLARVQAQNGNSMSALAILKESLHQLKVELDTHPTFEKCDTLFMEIAAKIKSLDRGEILSPLGNMDPHELTVGAILTEAISAAWWSDSLVFYNLALAHINRYLKYGRSPHSSAAFLYVAMIALSRFNMVEFAAELGNQCLEILERTRDSFFTARGYMLYTSFVSHIHVPISVCINHSELSVECSSSAGDRMSVILSYGLSAQMRLFASENVALLESICQYCCEEVPGWHQDTRGGTYLIAVRQVCRALQGKTDTTKAHTVMTDDQHNSNAYKTWLDIQTRNGGRSVLIYETNEIIVLYLYGHYQEAQEMGERCIDKIDLLWSSRNTRAVLFFHGLAVAGLVQRKLNDPRTADADLEKEVRDTIVQLENLNKRIKGWQVVLNANYLAWSKLLDAQIEELRGDHGTAIRHYETALDHASEYSLLFEEALGNFLMAGFFVRRSARRSATAALKESVALWRQLGAIGIAQRIEEDHSFLLHSPIRYARTAEVAVQTDFAGDSASVTYATDGDDPQSVQTVNEETKETRMAAWRGSTQPEAGAGLPALDMIDLHAILVSSQVISSVLQVDVLLKTMCDVILQTCGGSATQAAIIVQDEDDAKDNWCIAASGDSEKGATAHLPGQPLIGTSLVAENVVLYCARFREVVFIPDLIGDERFGKVSDSWAQGNSLSKAIIAIPICHGAKPLLGVLYLEGEPDSFTDRNVTVLQLLVNQIGISYSNALSIKAIEKVSSENEAMVRIQKQAVAKAKHAEAEAKRNVKIAEEAAKAKSIFLANVSHELRTPLNGVIGNSELLRDSNLNKEQLEMADSIRVSADLLLTVINDILDFSKMEADKMKLYITAFNPEEMVREVVRAASYSNREKTSKKNVKIIQDINLPPMLIYGDPIRLHQVLGNLISNSLKFTEDGSITIGAKVEFNTLEKAKLTFWVEDTGIGIPQDQLKKLFRPFSQADASTARKYGGSGLGLSICKSLIENMMKGEISLESRENEGTRASFTVTFDKAKPHVSAGEARPVPTPPVTDIKHNAPQRAPSHSLMSPVVDLARIPKDQIRICIAEDNLINQKIAIKFVHKLGYTKVDAYENGFKAVEGLRQQAMAGDPYHIVLMDVQMPVLDGYEATAIIRKDPIEEVRKVLVIAMTASAIQGDRERCLASGMNDYLAKPVKAGLLKRKLDTYTTGTIQPPTPPARHQSDPLGRFKSQDSSDGNSTPVPSSPLTNDFTMSGSPPLVIPMRENIDYSYSTDTSNGKMSPDQYSPIESANVSPTQQTAKRQPRKLTKPRSLSDAETTTDEKPRVVLTKKNPRQNNSSALDSDTGHENGLSS
ncbi:putative histidine kinase HHK1p [Daldinia caldariorum]|uniref:putative histidine kinase HHK1p n=1 Tax=Daldinia caldariorum TaxID=326644 RepID=UPI002008CB8E|nr:putative histidine kinase HHK1p [Daldinia caldariorum]KAI1471549.1 putative histidine kinase HHK1p [Daldinia caldariorum]